MKNFLSKILDQPTQPPIFKFIPQIKISPSSTLHLQIQPNDPHTASNIVINAFISKTNRTLLPIKIQWSRYKFKSNNDQYTIQKINIGLGNTYMCQPSDLGSIIQVKIKCLDPMINSQAQATIGPIRIDAMLKRLIDGALYNQSLLSQTIFLEGNDKINMNFRLNKNWMEFQDMMNSSQKLIMNYTLSEPKIQLSPKDPCKVYLRFQQDTNNTVRNWLDKVFDSNKNSKMINQSSLSIKIPHSNVSAASSKNRLFQKSHIHCINKIQVKFLSRNSRDLFLFTLRAFICKQDMKNSLIMQKIQTLQSLKTQQDYNKFLQYISLKSQIIRLAQIAKQLQNDRDNKIKDINLMQQSISQMTFTYLKIIQQKSQNQQIDLQQSYSMISLKRQQILGRKNFRQLKNQNQKLKSHIRDLSQQLQLQKFFKKQNNQSMIFNQTQNPFLKKNNISNIIEQNNNSTSYIMMGPQQINNSGHNNTEGILNINNHKNMLQISKSYLKVLQQNTKLKNKNRDKNRSNQKNNQSKDIQNLLQSLHQSQEEERKMNQMEYKIRELQKELTKIREINQSYERENKEIKQKLSSVYMQQSHNQSSINNYKINNPIQKPQPSYLNYSRSSRNNSSMLSNNNTSYINMSMNQSMTSEAELNMLQKKLMQLSKLNQKFQAENTRLRRQRDYYRGLYDGEIKKKQILEQNSSIMSKNIDGSLNNSKKMQEDSSIIIKLREQKQRLQNQNQSLLKKIDSITKQSHNYLNNQRKCQQLIRQNQKLMQQNQKLQKTIQNVKNYHQLQKKQQTVVSNNNINFSKYSTNTNSNTNININMKQKQQQIVKLKKVNNILLDQIKQLKKQIQKMNDNNLQKSRVIELKNQLEYYQQNYNNINNMTNHLNDSNKNINNNSNNNNYLLLKSQKQCISPSTHTLISSIKQQQLLNQIVTIKKQNHRLKQQIKNLQLKISTQTKTIEKLMSQIDQFHHTNINNNNNNKLNNTLSQNQFNRKYLKQQDRNYNRCQHNNSNTSQSTNIQLQRYKKRITQLQTQIILIKRNAQAFNRSHDLSMSMIGYDEQKLQLYKKQNQNLMIENQNLSKICSKYAKDARQANIQINKLKQKIIIMNKERFKLDQEM